MIPDDFQFSQTSLQDYVDCARRFELRYVQGVRWPAVVAEPSDSYERLMQLGEDFHRLVHQSLAGIPDERLTASISDPQLAGWWSAFQRAGLVGLPDQRYAEITLFAPLLGRRLIAKYDLLAIEPGGRAVIMDWKTGQNRPKRETLARRLQTLVYPYVLVEAGTQFNGGQPIAPEQVEMMYWFAEHPAQPERFVYSAAQHTEAGQQLAALLREVMASQHFPLTEDETRCGHCIYRSLCGRGVAAGGLAALDGETAPQDADDDEALLDFDFDQIAEAEF